MNSNGFNLQKHDDFHLLKKCLQLGYWLKKTKGGSDISFRCVTTLKSVTWSFSGSGDHYKAQWNSFNCFSNKALPINTNCWRKKNIIHNEFQELFFFNSFSFTFSILGIFTAVCNDLSKSNYFLPPRKHLSSDVEKVKRCVLAPFFWLLGQW